MIWSRDSYFTVRQEIAEHRQQIAAIFSSSSKPQPSPFRHEELLTRKGKFTGSHLSSNISQGPGQKPALLFSKDRFGVLNSWTSLGTQFVNLASIVDSWLSNTTVFTIEYDNFRISLWTESLFRKRQHCVVILSYPNDFFHCKKKAQVHKSDD